MMTKLTLDLVNGVEFYTRISLINASGEISLKYRLVRSRFEWEDYKAIIALLFVRSLIDFVYCMLIPIMAGSSIT
jgi:hypothetical protein